MIDQDAHGGISELSVGLNVFGVDGVMNGGDVPVGVLASLSNSWVLCSANGRIRALKKYKTKQIIYIIYILYIKEKLYDKCSVQREMETEHDQIVILI